MYPWNLTPVLCINYIVWHGSEVNWVFGPSWFANLYRTYIRALLFEARWEQISLLSSKHSLTAGHFCLGDLSNDNLGQAVKNLRPKRISQDVFEKMSLFRSLKYQTKVTVRYKKILKIAQRFTNILKRYAKTCIMTQRAQLDFYTFCKTAFFEKRLARREDVWLGINLALIGHMKVYFPCVLVEGLYLSQFIKFID